MQTAFEIANELNVKSVGINFLALEQFPNQEKNIKIFEQIEYSQLGLPKMLLKYFPEFSFSNGDNYDKLVKNENIENKAERLNLRAVDIIEDILERIEGQEPTTYIMVTHRMHLRSVRDVIEMDFPISNLREYGP